MVFANAYFSWKAKAGTKFRDSRSTATRYSTWSLAAEHSWTPSASCKAWWQSIIKQSKKPSSKKSGAIGSWPFLTPSKRTRRFLKTTRRITEQAMWLCVDLSCCEFMIAFLVLCTGTPIITIYLLKLRRGCQSTSLTRWGTNLGLQTWRINSPEVLISYSRERSFGAPSCTYTKSSKRDGKRVSLKKEKYRLGSHWTMLVWNGTTIVGR
jgi:hypothetical protein